VTSIVETLNRAGAPIRARLVGRRLLAGLGLGLVGGATLAGVAYWLRIEPRPAIVAAASGLGLAVGAWVARARQLSLHELSLYLDHKLGTKEAISTALSFQSGAEDQDSDTVSLLVARAETALREMDLAKAAPRFWSKLHASLPVGAALSAAVCLVDPRPSPPVPSPPPHTEQVDESVAAELERVLDTLEKVTPRDPAQEKRLDALAEKARTLKEKVRKGASKRDVQSELAELSRGVLAEKLSFGDGAERAGLESALEELGEPSLQGAKEALEDRDLTELDAEMSRLANELEKESRAKARKALEDAAKAAREQGAPGVAENLEEQAKKLEERGRQADALKQAAKQLEDQLSDLGKKDLEELEKTGDPEAKQRLAEEIAEKLSKMSDAESQELAKKIEEEAKRTAADPNASKQAQDAAKRAEALARELGTAEGKAQLERQMRELAKDDVPSPEAQNQELLRSAQAALDKAKRDAGQGGPSPEATGSPSGAPGASSGEAPKTKKRRGTPTDRSSAKSLKSRANTSVRDGTTLPITKTGRTGSRPGETANRAGKAALGQVSAEEVDGVSRSDVPEEYREQVGRYFEP
jgi:hypothetical protein